jgi:hypothetical protein
MNDNLLDKVSVEKLDALLDALCEVISDMREAEPEKGKRYQDETYPTCMVLNSMVFDSLRRRINKQ